MGRLLLVLFGLLLWQPRAQAGDCLAGTAPSPLPVMIAAEQNIEYYNVRNASIFNRQYNAVPDNQIVFVGDSHFDSLDTNLVTNKSVDLGIAGDTWRGLLNRIGQYPATNPIHRALACVLLIGINDIAYEGANYNANVPYMIDMFDGWATGNWVIVLIPYVNEVIANQPGLNAKIAVINTYMVSKWGNRDGFLIVDPNPTLAPTGQLLAAYTLPNDGVHLNGEGDRAIRQVIQSGFVGLSISF